MKRRRSHSSSWVRRHPWLSAFIALVLVLALLLLLLWHQLDKVPRFEFDPPGRAGPDTTILLVGVDNPDEDLLAQLQAPRWRQGVFRSDAILVVHVESDGESAKVVSIPRDSWVDVEGHGKQKINAAFSFGGPRLLADTVSSVAGIRIDHAVVTDMTGLADFTEVVGGVDVHLAEDATDPRGGGTLEQGRLHLEGDNTLGYLRQRYGLPRGDFDRVQRHQNFLRATVERLTDTGVVGNPLRMTRLLYQVDDLMAVSGQLPAEAPRLALKWRSIRAPDIDFMTAPHDGTATIGGQSVVNLDVAETRDLFDAIREGAFDRYRKNHDVTMLPSENDVR